ncbi:hypothetical protein [Archangium lipolyticum]|uniref:hypothetical protein n=1 Tax=Archangium lipolyticum TaxID=2970465 RepID=UPI00214A3306|nr:hypothetical protein [Archangium lipolyticum]
MAATWDNVLPSLITSLFDKAILGGVLAVVGFWFQKRLEVYKRDQSLASEWAKARMAAYHRVLSALSKFDIAVGLLQAAALGELPTSETRPRTVVLQEKREGFQTAFREVQEVLAPERLLIGVSFTRAIARYVTECHTYLVELQNGARPDEPALERKDAEIDRLRKAIDLCLPPFARPPAGDRHFSAPELDDVIRGLDVMEMKGPKK